MPSTIQIISSLNIKHKFFFDDKWDHVNGTHVFSHVEIAHYMLLWGTPVSNLTALEMQPQFLLSEIYLLEKRRTILLRILEKHIASFFAQKLNIKGNWGGCPLLRSILKKSKIFLNQTSNCRTKTCGQAVKQENTNGFPYVIGLSKIFWLTLD